MISITGRAVSTHRILIAVVFALLSATAVSAYTVVMRDGRTIEIPDNFTVTATTLTYELNGGIQVTLLVAGIDVVATEQTNGEDAGAFLHRSRAPKSVVKATPVAARASRGAQRSITNQNLEPYKRARLQSERAYEQRRRELGLPSAEESRRGIAEMTDRVQAFAREKRGAEEELEEYWRSRSRALSDEMTTSDSKIQSLRRQIDQLNYAYSSGGAGPFSPFGTFGIAQAGLGQSPFGYGSQVYSGSGIVIGTNVGSGYGYPNRRYGNRGGYYGGGRGRRVYDPFYNRGYGSSYPPYDYTFGVSELVNQLEQLETQRSMLQRRWLDLQEEARRKGAYPGWLR
jgi:hypothetical protein